MIINNEGYKLSDQHRNRVWDLYKKKLGALNPQNNLIEEENQVNFAKSTYSQDIHASDLTITQADGRTGLQIPTSSRLGLAAPPSANSVIWTPIMTPRKAPSADDPSINEIDSADFFPSHSVNKTTTTEKPNIVWGEKSGIVPGPNNRVGDSEVEWLTSTTTSTTKAPDTRLAVPENPTSLAEFINAQLSLFVPMWTNLIKLTDHFSREFTDTITSVLDYLWEIFALFFSDRKRRAIRYDNSQM